MTTHARARRPHGIASLALAAALAAGLAGPSPARAEPPAPEPLPSADERVAYWLERVLAGPEETTWPTPNFHRLLLADATQNLAALGEATLDRLDDAALQQRVQSADDANPWHAILAALGLMASPRPDTVRAWAVPAIEHRLYTLRRQATPVLSQLRHPADAPLLLAQLRRDGGDGFMAGHLSKALLTMGTPWDGEAARVVLDQAVADQVGHTSGQWSQVPVFAAMAEGGARADLLAWWALLAEASGPRARREAASPEPDALRVVGVEHASTAGGFPAAQARADLAKMGFGAAHASLEADLRSGDAALAGLARERLALPPDPSKRARLRANAERLVRTLETVNVRPPAVVGLATGEPAAAATETEVRDGEIPPVPTVAALLAALGEDDSPEVEGLLARFLFAPVQTRAWSGALRNAYLALERWGSASERAVEGMLASREPELVSRAFALIRDSKSPNYIATLEAWVDQPEVAAWRFEARRLLVYLYVTAFTRGGVGAETLSSFARRVAGWTADPKDASAGALAAALLDLGPPGEAQFAEGLGGPRRAAFVGVLSFRPRRYVGPEVVAALLGPVGRDTPLAERRAALSAALSVASSASLPYLDALVLRLRPDDRPDAAWIRRIVRHRVASL